MSKKTKIFNTWGKEGQERRKRIKESRDAIICIRTNLQSKFYEAKLVPPSEFKAEDYPNALCTNIYGDMCLVMLNYFDFDSGTGDKEVVEKIKKAAKKEFAIMFQNKDVFISKKYKDLDGQIAQTKFVLY